ncbi:unnamed protein product, partial [Chrysoparadoxa australica]
MARQDPFVRVTWKGQAIVSSIKKDAGKEADWDDELMLLVGSPSDLSEQVLVEVINDNQGDDKVRDDVLIGKGLMTVNDLLNGGTVSKTLELH